MNDILEFKKRCSSGYYKLYKTGLDIFDDPVERGLLPGSVVGIEGGPGVGKTTFVQMILESMARKGHETFYFTKEIDLVKCKDLVRNCFLSGLDHDLNSLLENLGPGADPDKKKKIEAALADFFSNAFPRLHYGKERRSFEGVLEEMEQILDSDLCKDSALPPVFCIDYIQGFIPDWIPGRNHLVSDVMRKLFYWAKEKKVFVFVTSVLGMDDVLWFCDPYLSITLEKDGVTGKITEDALSRLQVILYVEKNSMAQQNYSRLWFDGKHSFFTK